MVVSLHISTASFLEETLNSDSRRLVSKSKLLLNYDDVSQSRYLDVGLSGWPECEWVEALSWQISYL